MSSDVGSIRKAHCANCGGDRNCDVTGHYVARGDSEYYQWRTDWYLLVCRGCEHVFVQTVSTNSEEYTQDYEGNAEYFETIETWPPISKRNRPEWLYPLGGLSLPTEEGHRLEEAIKEVYGALDAGLNTLAAIGVRTSFDIAAELIGVSSEKTFEEKLTTLVENGHIRDAERGHLALLIDAGSASAHRGWKSTFQDLGALMDILEGAIHEWFVAPVKRQIAAERVLEIKGKVPPRTPRKGKATSSIRA
ncbi:DUF4145 domain-containing protein [Chelativorans sp. J32]|uniref:DUF4145 domain-containing protein n=1 Tax=Chelativorans sp. J32 TaxID=935840 RepID=UPI00047F7CDB|nr:DUF4145 domain-containing protein [Chelativorans sp. J32]